MIDINTLISVGELGVALGTGYAYLRSRLATVENGLRDVRKDIKKLRRTMHARLSHGCPPSGQEGARTGKRSSRTPSATGP